MYDKLFSLRINFPGTLLLCTAEGADKYATGTNVTRTTKKTPLTTFMKRYDHSSVYILFSVRYDHSSVDILFSVRYDHSSVDILFSVCDAFL
jgi:hypothetical protein